MYAHNRLLIEMDNAIKLSRSNLPQEKQIAVIIFDHLIEVVLYNAVKAAFEWPIDASVNVVLDSKTKKTTLNNYDAIIKFAKKLHYINDYDESLLKFTHTIRNEIYHQGMVQVDIANLALTIYFHFITGNKAILTKSNGLTAVSGDPGHEPIDFGQGLPSDPFERLMSSDKYVTKAFDYLVGKIPNLGRFEDLAFEYFENIIHHMESDMEYVENCKKNLNFYDAIVSSALGDTAPIFRKFAQQKRKP